MNIFLYNHLKSLIPEASQYFMDAVLSEPPISQGQRRRIIFLIDILIKTKLLVVDEPMANLDLNSSKLVFDKLKEILKVNNSCILVLDQKIIPEICNYLTNNKTLGNIYNFVPDKSNYKIEESPFLN